MDTIIILNKLIWYATRRTFDTLQNILFEHVRVYAYEQSSHLKLGMSAIAYAKNYLTNNDQNVKRVQCMCMYAIFTQK